MRLSMIRGFACGVLAVAAPASAQRDTAALSIHISLAVRQLWVIDVFGDTLLTTSVAIGSGRTLSSGERSWTFRTPTGETRVVAKQKDPVWIPPDWHYAELAERRGLELAWLPHDVPVLLSSGRLLLVQDGRVGVTGSDSVFTPVTTRDIVFDNTLFIPPFGTEQRRLVGTLGAYRLLLANGVGLHGTDDERSIGRAVTHGCIRLRDDAIAWLYENIPVGTVVLIH